MRNPLLRALLTTLALSEASRRGLRNLEKIEPCLRYC